MSSGRTPPPMRSLARRALLAAALFVGFYLLALVIIAVLILIPFVEYRTVGTVHIQLVVVCVIGAGLIVGSVWPERTPFVPPGPRLDPAGKPRLFAELARIAEATGQQMPQSVYAVLDVNAAVWQMGGVLAFRAKRAMVIGLPLLAVVSVRQLRAVVAHEFGHYHHGDTRLGPWIYGTRAAMIRTVVTLSAHGRTIIRLPFIWYGSLFLRTTLAVSRRQEFAADELAASLTSPEDVAGGLRETLRAGSVFAPYMLSEYLPLLEGGYRLPLAEGFVRFLRSAPVSEATEAAVDGELKTATADPYDSHPSLPERLGALEALPAAGDRAGGGGADSALSLLRDLDGLELRLIRRLNLESVDTARLLPWDSVASEAWGPIWERACAEHRLLVESFTTDGLADIPHRSEELGRRLASARERQEAAERSLHVLAAALTLALLRNGWAVNADPGAAVVCTRDADSIEPFGVVTALRDGTLAPDDWRRRCTELGISDLPLADPSWPPESEDARGNEPAILVPDPPVQPK